MTSRLSFQSLSVRGFRNISELTLEPAERLNVLAGDNGQGKTSLLEAVYFLATSRSFRAERMGELVQQGQSAAVVRAQVVEQGVPREQRAAITGGRRSLKLDDKAPKNLASYATRTPVVVFHPGDLALGSGPASVRRTLLSRVALYFEPTALSHQGRYTRAARERQRLLDERGTEARELEVFEILMAESGALLAATHRRAAERLAQAVLPAFRRMAAPDLQLEVRYQPGGAEDREVFQRELFTRRLRDKSARRPSFGPQRDDLELSLDGRSARRHASQGQLRVLTLALKLAELTCVREARGAHPVLLLDDVSSELDPERTGAVYRFVREAASQVFVTTTRPELFTTPELEPDERRDFRLVRGALERTVSPS
ncbi:MAG: DNA replication and repair protein RecF [Polyangiaceae bacterium]|nr:DNA replication and repair protein RecF [Polyangiaceae bacterium]MCW5790114.1 DNA replication and repair protein RecF [Polyangiaceae bacterium]